MNDTILTPTELDLYTSRASHKKSTSSLNKRWLMQVTVSKVHVVTLPQPHPGLALFPSDFVPCQPLSAFARH